MLTDLPIMLPAYPEIFLLAAGCAILVIDLYLKDGARWVSYALSLATLLGCAVLTLGVTAATGGQPATTFNGMFVSDMMATVLKMCTYVAVAACLVYPRTYLADSSDFRQIKTRVAGMKPLTSEQVAAMQKQSGNANPGGPAGSEGRVTGRVDQPR